RIPIEDVPLLNDHLLADDGRLLLALELRSVGGPGVRLLEPVHAAILRALRAAVRRLATGGAHVGALLGDLALGLQLLEVLFDGRARDDLHTEELAELLVAARPR